MAHVAHACDVTIFYGEAENLTQVHDCGSCAAPWYTYTFEQAPALAEGSRVRTS